MFKVAGKYLLIPIVKYYLRKDRNYSYKGIRIRVKKGVFHPGLFFSTKILFNYMNDMNLTGVKLLELGAGTGLISIFAAKKGAIVSASDISALAVENLKFNAKQNDQVIQVIESDLFLSFPPQTFDVIAIQPPFYPKEPNSIQEFAWYCGKDFDFFRQLFQQIGSFINTKSQVLMILSDDCAIETISRIAYENGFEMKKVFGKEIFWEWNYIFQIETIQSPV